METQKRRGGASKGYREMVYEVGRRACGATEAKRGAGFQRKGALRGIKSSQGVKTVKGT